MRENRVVFLRVLGVRDIRTLIYIKRKKEFDNYVCMAFAEKSTKLYSDQEIAVMHFLIPETDELLEDILKIASLNQATVSNNTIFSQMGQPGYRGKAEYANISERQPRVFW